MKSGLGLRCGNSPSGRHVCSGTCDSHFSIRGLVAIVLYATSMRKLFACSRVCVVVVCWLEEVVEELVSDCMLGLEEYSGVARRVW